jgi:hypothetical protein
MAITECEMAFSPSVFRRISSNIIGLLFAIVSFSCAKEFDAKQSKAIMKLIFIFIALY